VIDSLHVLVFRAGVAKGCDENGAWLASCTFSCIDGLSGKHVAYGLAVVQNWPGSSRLISLVGERGGLCVGVIAPLDRGKKKKS
jgi:hypothetical protein